MDMNSLARLLIVCVPVLLVVDVGAAQQPRNGKLYDPGIAMAAPAVAVAAETSRLSFLIGDWDVDMTTFPTDSTTAVRNCVTTVSYMNRGHGIMERMHCASNGNNEEEIEVVRLYAYSAGAGKWTAGIADGHAESISVFDGGFEDADLVLRNAIRIGGSVNVTYFRVTIAGGGDDPPRYFMEVSTDHGATWRLSQKMSYRKRAEPAPALTVANGFGAPAEDLPEEARQFDFLIGEWSASHEMAFPNGQTAQWQSNATAVYALGGRAARRRARDVSEKPPRPRDAASLILLRRRRHGHEVLLGRRRAGSRFMPNFYVFPGGVVDAADALARPASPLSPALAPAMAVGGRATRARTLAMAAVRETVEETGLVVGEPGDVGQRAVGTWAAMRSRGLAPALRRLDYVGRAITPTRSPLRYHARFFTTDADHAEGDLLDNDGELTDLRWIGLDRLPEVRLARVTAFMLTHAVKIAAASRSGDIGRPLFAHRNGAVHVRYCDAVSEST